MRIINPSACVMDIPDSPQAVLQRIEACGRVCYKSEDKITEDSYKPFITRIIQSGHEAVLEHGNILFSCDYRAFTYFTQWFNRAKNRGITLYLRFSAVDNRYFVSGNARAWRDTLRFMGWCSEPFPPYLIQMAEAYSPLFDDFYPMKRNDVAAAYGQAIEVPATMGVFSPYVEPFVHCAVTTRFIVDRGVTHEIVRHRPASYCQESTRYCNYSKGKFGNEITVIMPCFFFETVNERNCWYDACLRAEEAYFDLLEAGCSPQEARTVLPNSLKAEIVMTATLSEWSHFLDMRCSEAAHPQMREVATQVREQMLRASLLPTLTQNSGGA